MVRKNTFARLNRERAERLAERRQREEEQLARIGRALSTIHQSVGHLDLAIEMANDRLDEAFDEISQAVNALVALGYRVSDIAEVVGVDPLDLRPGLSLSLRRTRARGRNHRRNTEHTATAGSPDEPPPSSSPVVTPPDGHRTSPDT